MKNITFIFLLLIILLTGCSSQESTETKNDVSKKTDEYFHIDGDKIYGFHGRFAPSGGTLKPEYINDVDIETFEVLGGGYTKDKNSAYMYNGAISYMKDVDVETFIYVGNYFAKDKNKVYFKHKIIKDADPETFDLIKSIKIEEMNSSQANKAIFYFSRDENNLYLYDKKMENVDPNTFEVLGWREAQDKNHDYILDINAGKLIIED